MGRTPVYVKLRIVSLSSKSKSINAIVRQLQEEGIKIRRQTVARILKKYKDSGSLADKVSNGRKLILSMEQLNFIDAKMEENDELTAIGLQKLLYSEMGVHLSTSTIKRTRRKLGWKKCGPRYCQMVRETNRIARLAFAQECLEKGEDFENVIFTDESTIWLERHGKICFRKEGRPGKPKPRSKHPFKVNVWAGISKRGATPILIFTGIMKKEFYVNEILDKVFLPFTRDTFTDGYRFQQDNDPKHKSKLAMQFIKDNGINYWPTPAESPDMNPIENLWHELKHYLRVFVKPMNKEELVAGIQHFWDTVSPEKCQRYIGHLRKVLPAVVEREGRASGY